MQRPEAKNPPKRPSISAETGNLKMGVKNPRRNGLFAVDVEICGFGRLDGGVPSRIPLDIRLRTGNFLQNSANNRLSLAVYKKGP